MKIQIIMLGKNKEVYFDRAFSDYQKKLSPWCHLDIRYVKNERVHGDIQKILEREGKRVLAQIPNDYFLIVLDEHGESFNSIELAQYFSNCQQQGISQFTFVIGSAYGTSIEMKKRAKLLLSLSSLTMSHQIARLVLLEQLYRIFTIQKGMRYHK